MHLWRQLSPKIHQTQIPSSDEIDRAGKAPVAAFLSRPARAGEIDNVVFALVDAPL